ncbi:MAG: hypothetical protein AB1767_09825 [Bacillota bacterium]
MKDIHMEIYALIGHRGTGKSHHAPLLAHQYQIEYIIDDGLLIKGNQILAGRSAKRENTRFGAVKRALFNDPEHALQIRQKLAEIKPTRVLILGTSRRMAQVITEELGLPEPSRYILIEEIATPEAIQTALNVREKENRHTIPLPTFAIKKDFPGYIIDPLRSFFSLPATHPQKVAVERSIVRPIYSSLGNFFIAEHVIETLVAYIVSQIPGVCKTLRVAIQTKERKVTLKVDLALILGQIPQGDLSAVLIEAQQAVKEQIEYLTGFYLDRVNVTAKKLYLDGEETGS